jgi:hypothetical protein
MGRIMGEEEEGVAGKGVGGGVLGDRLHSRLW